MMSKHYYSKVRTCEHREGYVTDEGFGATYSAVYAEKFRNKREAAEAGRFYAQLCRGIATDYGLSDETEFLGVEVA